jgi:DNA (cytosine-5)-methyltransferase 1
MTITPLGSGRPPRNGPGLEKAGTVQFLSLFSGIGGLDLGLERAGMACVGQVEIDDYCQRVLAKHWPEVPRHDDVRTCIDWWRAQPRPPADLICGGFPCQDISVAGRGAGIIEGTRSSLWSHMAHVGRLILAHDQAVIGHADSA